MTSGVYAIVNRRDGNCYIGASGDIVRRHTGHLHDLRAATHCSAALQSAWDLDGEGAFVFTVLQECTPDECVCREQWWMDFLHPSYNTFRKAAASGVRQVRLGRSQRLAQRLAKDRQPG